METNYLSGGTQYQNLLTMMETMNMMSPSIISLLGLASASVSSTGSWTDPACVQLLQRSTAQPSHPTGSPRGRAASDHSGERTHSGLLPNYYSISFPAAVRRNKPDVKASHVLCADVYPASNDSTCRCLTCASVGPACSH